MLNTTSLPGNIILNKFLSSLLKTTQYFLVAQDRGSIFAIAFRSYHTFLYLLRLVVYFTFHGPALQWIVIVLSHI